MSRIASSLDCQEFRDLGRGCAMRGKHRNPRKPGEKLSSVRFRKKINPKHNK